jgi:cytidyltransferase-like protein
MITVAISGGFDPIHVGHVQLMEKAKSLGDKLVVILNNDHWLQRKKGFVFMTEQERAEICRAIKFVDEVIITNHLKNPKDMSVCAELELLHPHIFANGGDRKADNIPEYQLCNRLDIEMIFNLGDKIQSSSELVKKVKENK